MKKNLILAALVFLCIESQAGFLLEPSIGYDSGTLNFTPVGSATSYKQTQTGTAFGVLLGYRFPMNLWVAADYNMGSGDQKLDEAGATSTKYSKTSIGAVVGYQWRMMRFWGGYGYQDQFTDKDTPEAKVKGTNVKLGLGVQLAKHAALNFEYIMPTYSKYDIASLNLSDQTLSGLFSKYSMTVYRIGLSFPFDFGK